MISSNAEPLSWAYIGASPLEWRAKQHAKLMARGDFAEALGYLPSASREGTVMGAAKLRRKALGDAFGLVETNLVL